MRSLFLAAVVAVATSSMVALPIAAQQAPKESVPEAVGNWLTAHHTPGTTLPAGMMSADKDATRFMLVGRAFEGTHELQRLEKEVWSASTGFDVVAVDVGFAEGEAADAWIRTGKGDLAAIAASFGPWSWSAADTQAFLEALHAAPTKPTFVGIGVGEPSTLLPPFLEFIRKAYPDGHQRAERVLDGLRLPGRNGRPRYWLLDDNERGVMRYGLDEQVSVLHDQQEAIVARSNAADYARAMRIVNVFSQYEETMRFEREAGDADPRGRILAENVMAASTQDGKPHRVLAFVHVRDLGRASDPTTFAAQLAKLSGTAPVCVATAVGSGSFLAFDPNDNGEGVRQQRKVALPPEERTPLENALEKRSGGPAVFDLRKLSQHAPTATWFAQRRSLRSARTTCGGPSETPWDYVVAGDFDAIVWIPSVSAAEVAAASSR